MRVIWYCSLASLHFRICIFCAFGADDVVELKNYVKIGGTSVLYLCEYYSYISIVNTIPDVIDNSGPVSMMSKLRKLRSPTDHVTTTRHHNPKFVIDDLKVQIFPKKLIDVIKTWSKLTFACFLDCVRLVGYRTIGSHNKSTRGLLDASLIPSLGEPNKSTKTTIVTNYSNDDVFYLDFLIRAFGDGSYPIIGFYRFLVAIGHKICFCHQNNGNSICWYTRNTSRVSYCRRIFGIHEYGQPTSQGICDWDLRRNLHFRRSTGFGKFENSSHRH